MEQRLEDKKAIGDAFRTGKVGGELSSLLIDYFKKYCVDKEDKNLGKIEKIASPYDVICGPLI